MDINYVLTAHGVLGSGSGKPPAIEEVQNFTGVSSKDGESVSLSWVNSALLEFILVEVYVSTSDLTGLNYKACKENHTLAYSGKEQSFSYPASKNTTYYFKAFAKYNTFGENLVSKGVSISVQTKDTEPPAPVTKLKIIKEDNQSVSLSWTNPTNTDYSKTKILYKVGSYPTSSTDGTVGYEGSGTSATITGLVNDTEHFFRVFTYDTSGNEQNSTVGMQIKATPSELKIYGVRIDTTNSNPETAVTYTDNAVGMSPAPAGGGASAWDNVYPFNQIRPVLFKDGVVVDELDKNDFSKTKAGAAANITTGAVGDVMIEFPKIWWKFERTGSNLDVKYATKQVDSTWKAWGHARGATVKDYCYISTYLGVENAGKLRSLNGWTPTANKTIGQFRTLAQANGTGYDQMGYYQLLMLQVLFIIRHKSRDSQVTLGRGYVDGNSTVATTGQTNAKGMNFGEATGKQQLKFMGIEDFWGNLYYWIDGMYSDSARFILIGTQNFNDIGTGYTSYGQVAGTIGGYIGDVQGGTETGFIIKSSNGTSTTHYPDYGYIISSSFPRFGGTRSNTQAAGAFSLDINYLSSTSTTDTGSRLMYL